MLNTYLTATQNLLQNPSAPSSLYSTAFLTTCINTARGQVAGEGRCIRALGTLSTTGVLRNYGFNAINVGSSNGISGVLHVRSVQYLVGGGFQLVYPQPWEYFETFHLNNPVPQGGPPANWSQYGQGGSQFPGQPQAGSAANGSLYIDPFPDIIYSLICDCVCYPSPLVVDTDLEAIPYLWTDAVPYFAAYLALLSSQVSTRTKDAEEKLNLFNTFMQRARNAANPDVLPKYYQQSDDPLMAGRLGRGGG